VEVKLLNPQLETRDAFVKVMELQHGTHRKDSDCSVTQGIYREFRLSDARKETASLVGEAISIQKRLTPIAVAPGWSWAS
jgi:hypothetical protein